MQHPESSTSPLPFLGAIKSLRGAFWASIVMEMLERRMGRFLLGGQRGGIPRAAARGLPAPLRVEVGIFRLHRARLAQLSDAAHLQGRARIGEGIDRQGLCRRDREDLNAPARAHL